MKKIIFTLFTLSIISVNAIAQAPQSFKYQAIARDNSGNIIANQNVSFRISILQGSTTGTSVYSETHTATTNQFGLANLNIGGGTVVSGNFLTIDWGANTYFTKVEFDAAGGTNYVLMGTSQLLSVPYALYSSTTGDTSMWRKNGSNVYYNKGNVGVGANNPVYKLDVEGKGYETAIRIKTDTNASLIFQPMTSATKSAKIFQNGDRLYFGSNVNIGWIDLAAPGSSFNFDNTGAFNSNQAVRVKSGKTLEIYNNSNSNWASFWMEPSGAYLNENYTIKVTNGDVYVSDNTKGIILKSPNGTCFRVTVDNAGNLVRTGIACP